MFNKIKEFFNCSKPIQSNIFNPYPGRFIIAIKEQPGIIVGQTYQILSNKPYLTLIGIKGVYKKDFSYWKSL